MRMFEEKSEQLFPHLLEYSLEQTQKHRELIKNTIETISNQLFVKQCIAVALPEVEAEIIEEIKQDIAIEMNEIPVPNLGCFNFTTLSSRQEQTGESRFQKSVLKIHPDIPKSQEFLQLTGQLRIQISEHVKDIETVKRQQYAEYVQEELEREKAAREAQYQENLTRIGKEKAEGYRKLQKERDAVERRRNEEEARITMRLTQNQALFESQRALQQEHNTAMLAMQEEKRRERVETFQRTMDERREEMRLHAENEKRLQEHLLQLASRQPVVVDRPGPN
jgi:hypothetical protein